MMTRITDIYIYASPGLNDQLIIVLMPSRSLGDAWLRHQMETFSTLLILCTGNSPVTGDFPAQKTVMRNFDIFFDLHMNQRLSKQSSRGWFETPSRSLWRHCDGKIVVFIIVTGVTDMWGPHLIIWGPPYKYVGAPTCQWGDLT